jgi:predicted nucleic acid-binding Zn ribbon protein
VGDDYYLYACHGCGQETEVNEAMRRVIHEEGCLSCGADADPSDFSTPI